MKTKSTDISYACGFEIIGFFLEWSKAERKKGLEKCYAKQKWLNLWKQEKGK